jgi:hypothetical protein
MIPLLRARPTVRVRHQLLGRCGIGPIAPPPRVAGKSTALVRPRCPNISPDPSITTIIYRLQMKMLVASLYKLVSRSQPLLSLRGTNTDKSRWSRMSSKFIILCDQPLEISERLPGFSLYHPKYTSEDLQSLITYNLTIIEKHLRTFTEQGMPQLFSHRESSLEPTS